MKRVRLLIGVLASICVCAGCAADDSDDYEANSSYVAPVQTADSDNYASNSSYVAPVQTAGNSDVHADDDSFWQDVGEAASEIYDVTSDYVRNAWDDLVEGWNRSKT